MRIGLIEGLWVVEGWFARTVGRVVLLVLCMLTVLLVGGGVWWFVLAVSAHHQEAGLKKRWQDMARPLESVLERFPDRGVNDSALRLEELAAHIGIDLVPRAAKGRVEPDPGAATTIAAVKPMLTEYSRSIARSGRAHTPPPPAEIDEYLRQYEQELHAVVAHLLEAEPPQWPLQTTRAINSPLPNLLGHITLSRVLTAHFACLLDAGHRDRAIACCNAAWSLQRSTRRRPELIAQLIALHEAQLLAGAVRRHPAPPARWAEMLLEHDYRESILDAYHFEAWVMWQSARSGEFFAEEGAVSWLIQGFSGPYLRAQMCHSAEAIRTAIAELPEIPFADYDAGERYAIAIETVVGDESLARGTMVDVWSTWSRVGRGMLTLELSSLVVTQRHQIASSARPRWPVVAESRPSRLMPSVTWDLRAQPGGLQIAAQQELPPVADSSLEALCQQFLVEVSP